ncbi:chain length determinant protein EpsF [Duganella sp. 1224]|uniref:chain length determinant protein EpsF n=1 Tax=Duganella sp. 1224 TaxID=2587052 RepID=UPI0015CE104F|nr:chain length determinant protein EpsF [Duganella sp. 1224]NYE62164.1 chain length determinant protein EpsF [Duganella sp. 1224]
MNLSQFLLALRARYKIVALVLVITVITTIIISLVLPKSYVGSTSLVVNYKGVDAITGLTMPAQLMPGYLSTQVDIIKSRAVALRAVDQLKLADNPAVIAQFRDETDGQGTVRDWLADLLLDKLDVLPSRESSVLTIVFKGADPQFVAAVANAFANAYLQTSVLLKTEPAQQASGYMTNQTKLLRDRYEAAQSKLSAYQQQHAIYNADNRLDVETARLNDLSSQLVVAQGQAMEATARRRQTQGEGAASPDVLNNSLIQNLKASLALAEAKLADTAQRLAPNHPQYQAAQSEVDKLRASLNEQIKVTSSGVVGNAEILQRREAELRQALAEQKAKVLALNTARDEFTVLSNEAENARRAYELAAQRYNQTSLEGQSNQTDVAILTPATAPIKPAGPKVLLNTALALVVGTMVGVGIALVLELRDRRVRSADELITRFELPLLGVIDKPRAVKRRRRLALPSATDGGARPAQA